MVEVQQVEAHDVVLVVLHVDEAEHVDDEQQQLDDVDDGQQQLDDVDDDTGY